VITGRDRLLAALFALQLVAAAAFGLVLVNGLGESTETVVATGAAPGVEAGPLASASAVAGTAGTAGDAGTAGTAGSSGTTATTGGGAQVTGPGGGGAAPAAAKVAKGAPIKIGSVVTQTGAINFAASAQGTKAYLDRVNKQGGVNGHKIVLDLRDDQLDAARGRAQAQQLLADGVFAFAGWQAPLTEQDIVPFLEANKIPLIGGYGTRPEYKSPYAFIFQSGHYGFEMGRFLAQEKDVTRPGVVFIGGAEAANAAQRQAYKDGVAAGGKTLRDEDIQVVDVTKASYDDVVTQFRLSGVDGIATLIDQTAYNRLQQSMDRQSYRPVHVANPLFMDPTVRQGPTTEGTLVASDLAFVNNPSPEVQDYVRSVRAQFGAKAQVSYLGLAGWLSARILTQAIERMGDDITRENLLKVMRTLPANSGGALTPPLRFGPASPGHDLNRCLQLGRVRSGEVVPYKPYACDDKTYG
jgi:ABC-type branched-subunit amino acid transport system substrate-binding protein